MRSFTAAALAMALLTGPAYSQGMSGGKKHHQPEQKSEEKRNKVDEKAYKSALDKMPDQKQKYDPWQNVRENPQAK